MDNIDEAQSVVRELVGSGIDRGDIGFANQKDAIPSSADLNESEGSAGNDGAILVAVAAESDAQADKAAGIMRLHGARDIGQRA
jgi:hypothetical protein